VPVFAHVAELEFARLLDDCDLRWEFEPRSFVLRCDAEGRVREAVTPDFYLPELDLYVELTTMRQTHVGSKRRKLRLLGERYPEVRVLLLVRRDLEALGVVAETPVPASVGSPA
jgi:hypoxanthine phosphoribosyltransferase